MFPFLNLGFIKIPMYGLCILTGIIIVAIISYKFSKKRQKNYMDFIIVVAFTLGMGVIFAKLLYILVTSPLKDFFKVIYLMLFKGIENLLVSSFIFYGGVIGFIIGIKVAKYKINDFIVFLQY